MNSRRPHALLNICCLTLTFALSIGCRNETEIQPVARQEKMTLEQQLKELEALGLVLNDGVTIDDLLYSSDRKEYEEKPFDLVMFMLGSEVEREPWGRPICDRAWNFDVECIEGTGSYVTIVENFCRVAGKPQLITDAEDFVDVENGKVWLKYTVNEQQRHFTIPVDNDWADPDTVVAIMSDIEGEGRRFYSIDNGQASIWFYLDEPTAQKLNTLTGNVLSKN